MKSSDRLNEILIGRGFEEVPKEFQDEGFGCHHCNVSGRNRKYYCDAFLVNFDYKSLRDYSARVDKIRCHSWCAPCLIWYYKEENDVD